MKRKFISSSWKYGSVKIGYSIDFIREKAQQNMKFENEENLLVNLLDLFEYNVNSSIKLFYFI